MIQLIATDMDGTLLGNDAKITQANAQAIKAAQTKGCQVVVATGRDYASASELIAAQNLNDVQLICLNGAQTRSAKGDLLEEITFPIADILSVYHALKDEKVIFQVYTSTDVYGENRDETIALLSEYFLSINEQLQTEDAIAMSTEFTDQHIPHFVDDFEVFLNSYTAESFLKIIVSGYRKDLIDYLTPKLAHLDAIAISASGGNNIEITHKDAQKGIALRQLAQKSNIALNNVMAIGDNLNDLSMLSVVGHPIAMGNAVTTVKETAKYTTKHNYDSGVAHAITKFVLN
ncbi:Cof-type HAD-IIB family hydrolase [Brochothrix campestris]|uniref:Cof-like hydrolase family protein n=1 Tax=Brochothrix campestris FSL F6-1037 TaxID=1265861 RepID=W7CT02_9LIST|nr:Cof-type HAD-IIB family hydrolase [Brochothrix campestris]EUJ38916.1 cof-like hydrolase family protein [Brochothrix campestris FSL F6-1037]